MSLLPLYQIKIMGVVFMCEVAIMTYVAPQWLDLISPLIALSRPGASVLGGW
jgi:hypothetical protein